MNVEFKWNKPIPQITKEATGGDRTLLFMANEAKRLMDPYVPARNMALSQDVRTYVQEGAGVVHYLVPYARFQHEGALMVSRITGSPWARHGETKVVTGKKLKYSTFHHPLATSEWEKAMKAARMGDYTAAVQRYVKGGG
ncbi:Uncharacterised protein [[Eubacterium] contortum]|uniref:Minor capsid protein n=1 Tax=Faecalicatena contorta TaxID=39482 RepID=A0A174L7X1_9FIRM|nr:minor capsid protein [Faecalicatena contorta]CUP20694.1 Uncharacterised protein [[Eubacterium] contortum] [Faecalicatena contorta]